MIKQVPFRFATYANQFILFFEKERASIVCCTVLHHATYGALQGTFSASKLETFHFSEQGAAIHAEQGGCPAAVAVAGFQRAQDAIPFVFFGAVGGRAGSRLGGGKPDRGCAAIAGKKFGFQRFGSQFARVCRTEPLDEVVEFPDIAAPRVVLQYLDSLGRKGFAAQLGHLIQKVPCQHNDVAFSFAQGRQVQQQNRKSVVEIGAEVSGLDAFPQISVGGGDDPDVDGNGVSAADTQDILAFKHAQQALLGVRVELGNLVQKQGTAVSQFKDPFFAFGACPGKGTFFIAEQLRFQKRLRQSPAVDGHKRAAAAGAGIVDGLGKQILPRTGFAVDQNGMIRRGKPSGPGQSLGQEV